MRTINPSREVGQRRKRCDREVNGSRDGFLYTQAPTTEEIVNFYGKRKASKDYGDEQEEAAESVQTTTNMDYIGTRPAFFSGGDLREYQLKGLQWLNVCFLKCL